MNRISQPDLHPDADVLSAFAEQALPPAERTAVLAHMGDCPRCREIVFLAQAAAQPATESPQPVSTLPLPRRAPSDGAWSVGAWISRGRAAWIPVAALAGVGGILLWVLLRPALPPATIAVNTPHEPVSMAAPSQPGQAQNGHIQAAEPSRLPARSASQNSLAAPADRAYQEHEVKKTRRPTPGPTHQPAVSPADSSISAFAPTSLAAVAPVQKSTLFAKPHIENSFTSTQWQPSATQDLSRADHSRTLSLASAQSPSLVSVESEPPPAVPPALPSLAGGMAVHGQAQMPAQAINGLTTLHSGQPVRLPNGLRSVSTAAVPGRFVAIDPEGSVFLSNDGGKSWEPVSPPWSGKALEVRAMSRYAAQMELLQAPATSRAADTSTPSSPPAPGAAASTSPGLQGPQSATPTLFRLVTDRRQTWVSSDGKVWRLQ